MAAGGDHLRPLMALYLLGVAFWLWLNLPTMYGYYPLWPVFTLAAGSLWLLLGWQKRWCAALLWLNWAVLFYYVPDSYHVGLPVVGWLLVAMAMCEAPMDTALRQMGWGLMALIYAGSGWHKWGSTSWQQGQAVLALLDHPMVGDYGASPWLRMLPSIVLQGLTWAVLTLELGIAPLLIWRRTRYLAWGLATLLQLILLLVLPMAVVPLSMLLLHAFVMPLRMPVIRRHNKMATNVLPG